MSELYFCVLAADWRCYECKTGTDRYNDCQDEKSDYFGDSVNCPAGNANYDDNTCWKSVDSE